MIAHARVINVMGEAHNKVMFCRSRQNLDQRYSAANDQLTEQRKVEVQRGYARKFCRLPLRQEVSDFFEQIKADANHHLIARSYRDNRSRLCSFVNKNFVARAVEQKTASINRHSLAAKRNEIVSGSRDCRDISALLERLPLRTIKEKQPRVVLRNHAV